MKVAGEGTLRGHGIGYEIKVGLTDFVQKVNYMRALQGELSRTISEFPGVESARVHFVIPRRTLFIEEQQQPSASVVLALIRPKVEVGEMVEGLEGLPAAEEQLALYEAQEEALRTAEEAAGAEEEEPAAEDAGPGDLEAVKNHIFHLADQHMEQAVIIIRSWIQDASETSTGARKAGARA